MALVAGVDLSTQSLTIVLRDAETGEVVGSASSPLPATTPPVSEQDPADWWAAFVRTSNRLDMRNVAAISVAGQGHGMVVLDDRQEVIRPVKLWNDTTSARETVELVERLGPEGWVQRCGSVPTPAFTITKLLWLARHEPENFARVAAVLMPGDWLSFRLTGAFCTDRSAASGTGYFSPSQSVWLRDILALAGGDGWNPELPAVLGPEEPAGTVSWGVASELGLPLSVVVGPGCNDQPPATLALGLREGDVVISIGTSGTVFTRSSDPTFDATGAVTGVADASGGFLPLVCTLNAAKVTDAFARLLSVDLEALSTLALHTPASPDRPVLVPYLDGERTPNRPRARGLLGRIRSDVTREELARAAFEGVVCGLIEGLDHLRRVGAPVDGRLVLVGGGAKSPAYRQLLADHAGRPVWMSQMDEVTASGAAVQAAAVLHERRITDVAMAWAPPLRIVAEPRDGQGVEEFRERYRRFAAEDAFDD